MNCVERQNLSLCTKGNSAQQFVELADKFVTGCASLGQKHCGGICLHNKSVAVAISIIRPGPTGDGHFDETFAIWCEDFDWLNIQSLEQLLFRSFPTGC